MAAREPNDSDVELDGVEYDDVGEAEEGDDEDDGTGPVTGAPAKSHALQNGSFTVTACSPAVARAITRDAAGVQGDRTEWSAGRVWLPLWGPSVLLPRGIAIWRAESLYPYFFETEANTLAPRPCAHHISARTQIHHRVALRMHEPPNSQARA